MKFTLLIFSFVAKQFLHRTVLKSELSKSKNIYDGYDHRYLEYNNSDIRQPIITQTLVTAEEINMFNKNNYKLNLLNKLLDPNVSTVEKLLEVELYEQHGDSYKHSNNINAGGLFDDWNITIL